MNESACCLNICLTDTVYTPFTPNPIVPSTGQFYQYTCTPAEGTYFNDDGYIKTICTGLPSDAADCSCGAGRIHDSSGTCRAICPQNGV